MEKLSLLNIFENIIDEFGVDQNMYPHFNLDTFKSLNSYSKRVNYCNQTLRRISSGSSRIVYQVDAGSVLKLAKNKYGLQQNRSEANEYNHDYFSEVRTNVLDYDNENDIWIISEIATKITPFMFKEYTGFDLKQLDAYLNLRHAEHNGSKITNNDFFRYMTPEEKDRMDNDDFVGTVVAFMYNNDLAAGDLGRISSWGLVKRNGHEQVVLTDYGFKGSYD